MVASSPSLEELFANFLHSWESEDVMGGGRVQRPVLCVYEPKKTGAHSAENSNAHIIHYAATYGFGIFQAWCVATGPKGAIETFVPCWFLLGCSKTVTHYG